MSEQTLKLRRWGNSSAIRFPKNILKQVGISPDDGEVNIKIINNTIMIKPLKKKSPLRKMFDGFDTEAYFKSEPNNKEIDWGKPQGKEIF